MKIFGIQKLTLIDYPGKAAASVFLSGCDFRCPYCHNYDFLDLGGVSLVDDCEVIDFLKSRQKLLDGVCISGGEPLLQEGIIDFIAEIKALGFDVKLDTNGQHPAVLKQLVERKLLDYVALDIKSSLQNYGNCAGIQKFDTSRVEESADFLISGTVPYEFRTTVVRELHKAGDFHLIGQRFKGAEKYYLQTFKNSEGVPENNFTAYSIAEMNDFCNILSKYMVAVGLRE